MKAKTGHLVGRALNFDITPMQFENAFNNRQAETRSTVVARFGSLVKALKDMGKILLADSFAAVA